MTQRQRSKAARALGQKGGAVRSEAKAEAARANGAKGGRPRKAPAPAVPAGVADGLRTLAALATAGGPEDVGLEAKDRRGWRNVQAAIAWIYALPEGR